MEKGLLFIVLCLCVIACTRAATCTWQTQDEGSFAFSDASAWSCDGGSTTPQSGDDVVALGEIDSDADGPITIQVDSTPFSLNSLYIGGNQITLTFTDLTVTSNLTSLGNAFQGTSLTLPAGSINSFSTPSTTVATDLSVATINNAGDSTWSVNLHVSAWTGVTLINTGTWTWQLGYNQVQVQQDATSLSSIINNGTMNFMTPSSVTDTNTGIMKLSANLTNNGFMQLSRAEIDFGTSISFDQNGIFTAVDAGSSVQCDMGDVVTFGDGAINNGSGHIEASAAPRSEDDPYMIFHIPGKVSFTNLVAEGYLQIYGGGLITADYLEFRGGILQVNLNVKNLTLTYPQHNIGEGNEPYSFEYANVTVSESMKVNQSFEYPLLLNFSASITLLPGVTMTATDGTIEGDKGLLTNYGTLDLFPGDSGLLLSVPIHNYGKIICEPGASSGIYGGGINNGTIVSSDLSVYGTSAVSFNCFLGDQYGNGWTFLPGTVYPTTGFLSNPGFFSSANCRGYLTGNCYSSGVWNFTYSATIPELMLIKTGVIYAPPGVTVTVTNTYMPGGIIDGGGNVILKNGSFSLFAEGANEVYISKSNLTIDGNFWLEQGNFNFKNGGNLVFTQNANVVATTSLSSSGTDSDDTDPSPNSMIINFGTFNFFDQSGTGSLSTLTPMLNLGNITLGKGTSSKTKGSTVKIAVPLNQAGNGAIVANVFSATDSDVYVYELPVNVACPINGGATLNFMYTPKDGDSVTFLTYNRFAAGYQQCKGYFTNVRASGLPSDLKINIMYDVSPDTYHDLQAVAHVCSTSSTASECTTQSTAGGAPINTNTTTTASSSTVTASVLLFAFLGVSLL